jgi:hypothetical protein
MKYEFTTIGINRISYNYILVIKRMYTHEICFVYKNDTGYNGHIINVHRFESKNMMKSFLLYGLPKYNPSKVLYAGKAPKDIDGTNLFYYDRDKPTSYAINPLTETTYQKIKDMTREFNFEISTTNPADVTITAKSGVHIGFYGGQFGTDYGPVFNPFNQTITGFPEDEAKMKQILNVISIDLTETLKRID